MKELDEFKIKTMKKRKNDIYDAIVSLKSGSMLDALYLIYNSKKDSKALAPLIERYFQRELDSINDILEKL